jgi:hypothetical protein
MLKEGHLKTKCYPTLVFAEKNLYVYLKRYLRDPITTWDRGGCLRKGGGDSQVSIPSLIQMVIRI